MDSNCYTYTAGTTSSYTLNIPYCRHLKVSTFVFLEIMILMGICFALKYRGSSDTKHATLCVNRWTPFCPTLVRGQLYLNFPTNPSTEDNGSNMLFLDNTGYFYTPYSLNSLRSSTDHLEENVAYRATYFTTDTST